MPATNVFDKLSATNLFGLIEADVRLLLAESGDFIITEDSNYIQLDWLVFNFWAKL